MSLVQAVEQMEEEIAKLKQERDELAALADVRRSALLAYQSAGFGNSTDFRLQGKAYEDSVRALHITGPDALREIQARTVQTAIDTVMSSIGMSDAVYRLRLLLAAAKMKGE